MQSNIKCTIYRTKRKSLLLKLKNDGSLALYCPKGCPKKKALDFLNANYGKMARLASEKEKKHLLTLFGGSLSSPTLLYFGERYPVLFGNVKKLIFDGKTFISPENASPEDLRDYYKDFLRAEAKRLLPSLTEKLAGEHGFTFSRVFIKDISSRFGSCSSKKNINFSLALPAFSESFINYIVIHELTHTVHLDHSKEFHCLLERCLPNARQVAQRYKKAYSDVLRSICR